MIEDLESLSTSAGGSSHKKRKLLKKAPDAPKRFKSAYICFIGEKMEMSKNSGNSDVKVTETMKVLANQWKDLPAEEKLKYESIAEADKARYYEEMAEYTGPMQVPNKRVKKNPNAPKRAMSAFLSYSQMMRKSVRAQYPHLKNTELSSVLATMWRDASDEDKAPHLEREQLERLKYHEDMSKWKEEELEKSSKRDSKSSSSSSQSNKNSYDTHGDEEDDEVYEQEEVEEDDMGHDYFNDESNMINMTWNPELNNWNTEFLQQDHLMKHTTTSSSSSFMHHNNRHHDRSTLFTSEKVESDPSSDPSSDNDNPTSHNNNSGSTGSSSPEEGSGSTSGGNHSSDTLQSQKKEISSSSYELKDNSFLGTKRDQIHKPSNMTNTTLKSYNSNSSTSHNNNSSDDSNSIPAYMSLVSLGIHTHNSSYHAPQPTMSKWNRPKKETKVEFVVPTYSDTGNTSANMSSDQRQTASKSYNEHSGNNNHGVTSTTSHHLSNTHKVKSHSSSSASHPINSNVLPTSSTISSNNLSKGNSLNLPPKMTTKQSYSSNNPKYEPGYGPFRAIAKSVASKKKEHQDYLHSLSTTTGNTITINSDSHMNNNMSPVDKGDSSLISSSSSSHKKKGDVPNKDTTKPKKNTKSHLVTTATTTTTASHTDTSTKKVQVKKTSHTNAITSATKIDNNTNSHLSTDMDIDYDPTSNASNFYSGNTELSSSDEMIPSFDYFDPSSESLYDLQMIPHTTSTDNNHNTNMNRTTTTTTTTNAHQMSMNRFMDMEPSYDTHFSSHDDDDDEDDRSRNNNNDNTIDDGVDFYNNLSKFNEQCNAISHTSSSSNYGNTGNMTTDNDPYTILNRNNTKVNASWNPTMKDDMRIRSKMSTSHTEDSTSNTMVIDDNMSKLTSDRTIPYRKELNSSNLYDSSSLLGTMSVGMTSFTQKPIYNVTTNTGMNIRNQVLQPKYGMFTNLHSDCTDMDITTNNKLTTPTAPLSYTNHYTNVPFRNSYLFSTYPSSSVHEMISPYTLPITSTYGGLSQPYWSLNQNFDMKSLQLPKSIQSHNAMVRHPTSTSLSEQANPTVSIYDNSSTTHTMKRHPTSTSLSEQSNPTINTYEGNTSTHAMKRHPTSTSLCEQPPLQQTKNLYTGTENPHGIKRHPTATSLSEQPPLQHSKNLHSDIEHKHTMKRHPTATSLTGQPPLQQVKNTYESVTSKLVIPRHPTATSLNEQQPLSKSKVINESMIKKQSLPRHPTSTSLSEQVPTQQVKSMHESGVSHYVMPRHPTSTSLSEQGQVHLPKSKHDSITTTKKQVITRHPTATSLTESTPNDMKHGPITIKQAITRHPTATSLSEQSPPSNHKHDTLTVRSPINNHMDTKVGLKVPLSTTSPHYTSSLKIPMTDDYSNLLKHFTTGPVIHSTASNDYTNDTLSSSAEIPSRIPHIPHRKSSYHGSPKMNTAVVDSLIQTGPLYPTHITKLSSTNNDMDTNDKVGQYTKLSHSMVDVSKSMYDTATISDVFTSKVPISSSAVYNPLLSLFNGSSNSSTTGSMVPESLPTSMIYNNTTNNNTENDLNNNNDMMVDITTNVPTNDTMGVTDESGYLGNEESNRLYKNYMNAYNNISQTIINQIYSPTMLNFYNDNAGNKGNNSLNIHHMDTSTSDSPVRSPSLLNADDRNNAYLMNQLYLKNKKKPIFLDPTKHSNLSSSIDSSKDMSLKYQKMTDSLQNVLDTMNTSQSSQTSHSSTSMRGVSGNMTDTTSGSMSVSTGENSSSEGSRGTHSSNSGTSHKRHTSSSQDTDNSTACIKPTKEALNNHNKQQQDKFINTSSNNMYPTELHITKEHNKHYHHKNKHENSGSGGGGSSSTNSRNNENNSENSRSGSGSSSNNHSNTISGISGSFNSDTNDHNISSNDMTHTNNNNNNMNECHTNNTTTHGNGSANNSNTGGTSSNNGGTSSNNGVNSSGKTSHEDPSSNNNTNMNTITLDKDGLKIMSHDNIHTNALSGTYNPGHNFSLQTFLNQTPHAEDPKSYFIYPNAYTMHTHMNKPITHTHHYAATPNTMDIHPITHTHIPVKDMLHDPTTMMITTTNNNSNTTTHLRTASLTTSTTTMNGNDNLHDSVLRTLLAVDQAGIFGDHSDIDKIFNMKPLNDMPTTIIATTSSDEEKCCDDSL